MNENSFFLRPLAVWGHHFEGSCVPAEAPDGWGGGRAEGSGRSAAIHENKRKIWSRKVNETFTLCYLPDRNNLTQSPCLALGGLCIQDAN